METIMPVSETSIPAVNIYQGQKFTVYIHVQNVELARLMGEFIKGYARLKIKFEVIVPFLESFESNLPKFPDADTEITEIFTAENLLYQAGRLREKCGDLSDNKNKTLFRRQIKLLITFYRLVVLECFPDFPNRCWSKRVNKILLGSPGLLRFLLEDYYFTNFEDREDLSGKTKIIFTIKNNGRNGQWSTEQDFFALDLSILQFDTFNDEVIKFICKGRVPGRNEITVILKILRMLFEIKGSDIRTLTVNDAVVIRQLLLSSGRSICYIASQIKTCRNFIMFLNRVCPEHINVDELFFEYFMAPVQYKYRRENISVSTDTVKKLMTELREASKDDIKSMNVYVILFLILTTPLRGGSVFRLKKGDIKKGYRDGDRYCFVQKYTKSSGIKEDIVPISREALCLLEKVIEINQSLSDKAPESLSSYVFLFAKKNEIKLFNRRNLYEFLDRFTKAHGIEERITTKLLRKRYMTDIFKVVKEEQGTEQQLMTLSNHKDVQTTFNHYISQELEDLMSSLFDVTLNKIDVQTKRNIASRVIDQQDNVTDDERRVVEHGCGLCTESDCKMQHANRCVVCSYFRTTIQHESFFINVIQGLDLLLREASTEHEKSDLNMLKTIYVQYLTAIYAKGGDNTN